MAAGRTRIRAGEEHGVGDARYALIRASASRIQQALVEGFFLEATTLVESILSERMEKRVQYLFRHSERPTPSLSKLQEGFANLGPLVRTLKANGEPTALLEKIGAWAQRRNDVVHAMAKLGRGSRQSWAERMQSAEKVAQDGVQVLLEYDSYDRAVSHVGRNRRLASATCPDALRPIGQAECEYCRVSSLPRP